MPRWPVAAHAMALAPAFLLLAHGGVGNSHAATGPELVGAASIRSSDEEAGFGGKAFATAAVDTAKFGSDAAPAVFPRTVKHAFGETKLEVKPQRIVVLDGGELDSALALGVTPVGMAAFAPGQEGLPDYLAERARRIAIVGETGDLDLEKIARLRPDLILGSRLRAGHQYEELAAIAPTVMSIRPGFPWKENFLLVGESLGEETKAAKVLGDYRESVSAAQATITALPTISLVRFMPNGIRLYANLSFIGAILEDIGLPRPALQGVDALFVPISPEAIRKAEGDWLLYSSFGAPDVTAENAVVHGEQWKAIPAVGAGRAVRVEDELWFRGIGPIGAMKIVADLQRILRSQAEAHPDSARRLQLQLPGIATVARCPT